MTKLLLFAVLALPAFPQFFGGSNASKIRGINVLGPLTVSDGCALVYVAASTRFECGAGSGGGTGNGIVAVTVSAATSATLTHNAALATPYIAPFVCREDTTNLPVIPATTTFTTNAIAFTFSPAFTGKCAASTGGSGISGTIATSQICYGSASNTCAGSAGLTFTDAANVRLATLAGGSSQSANALLDVTNSAGSSHWLTVLGDGKVGVGTNAPIGKLQIQGSVTDRAAYFAADYANTINGDPGKNDDNGSFGINFVGYNGGTTRYRDFIVYNGKNVTLAKVVGISGTFGIGPSNTSPAGTLHVYDATASTGSTTLTVKAGQGQSTTNLQEWQNNAGTAQMSFGSGGLLFADNTYSIGASNASRPSSLYVVTRVNINNAASLRSTADGTLLLYNNGESDFNRLQLGGTTSSFPALKHSTTGLISRLADDSADTWFQASQFRSTLTTPASAAATCTAGTIVADTGFVYVCTATDTWKRVAIASW